MYRKEDLWLDAEDIRRKYPKLFIEDGFTASFIGLLFDANLLRGRYDRTKRQVFILEESFIDLLKHMKYNYLIQANYLPGDEIKFSIPPYCCLTEVVTIKENKHWYTPTEVLELYPKLYQEKIFNESFIGQLVHKNIIRGKFDSTEKCTLILKPSFDELLKYRNYMIEKNKTQDIL
ncbi:MAG TPA: hypothetical protein VN698_04020 [Bacteroidia bacterium]|nr:hypothetical protein [Bacteroidia bacterium]